jgi:S-(hydroxymethyl)glutathione dehydrogenase/alcohol dehydrogenase
VVNYPITFNGAILERNSEALAVDEIVFAGPLEAGQVLVRIHYSGICGKQIEEIEGTGGPDPYLPHMLGHEGSGVVVDVGPGVMKVCQGDHVVLHWLKGSGINATTPIYSRGGKRVNAGWVTSFNEYGVISENRLTPIPRESDSSIACLLGCAVTTGVGVILNDANVRPGESVSVFGCGGVGLMAVQAAALVHGYPVIAVDKNPASLKMALTFGASHAVNSESDNVVAEIQQITNGKGTDFAVVAVGKPNVIELAARASSVPGSVFVVGVPPSDSEITVDALAIHRQKMFKGSHGGATVPERDIPRYLTLYERGLLKLDKLVSNSVTLDSINDGVDLMKAGTIIGRCVVDMTRS